MKRFLSIIMACRLLLVLIPVGITAESGSADVLSETDTTLFGFAEHKLNNTTSHLQTPQTFVGFNSENPNALEMALQISDVNCYAAEYVNGFIYAYVFDYIELVDADDMYPMPDSFYKITPNANGSWTSQKLATLSEDTRVVDMTYAADRNIMYAMVMWDNTDPDGLSMPEYHLMTVNLTNGSLTDVSNLMEKEIDTTTCFAYIGNGRFYSTDAYGNSIIFDENGVIETLGRAANHAFERIVGATYYAPGNCIYAARLRTIPAGNFSNLLRIDLATGLATDLGSIGGNYGYSLQCLFAMPDYEIEPTPVATPEAVNEALNAPGSNLSFINGNSYPWQIVTEGSRVYMKSGNYHTASSSSKITAVFRGLTAGQVLSFDWSVSSESNYDWLTFNSNGTRVNRISGSASWTTYSYTVPANGDYTFEWIYSKDSSENSGSDCGMLDNISITGNQPEPYDPGEGIAIDEVLNVEGGTLTFYDDLTNPWKVNNDGGRTYVESTTHTYCDMQTVYMIIDNAHAGDAVRFDWKTSINMLNGRLLFRMNTAIQAAFYGETDWDTYTFVVPTDGQLIFSWTLNRTVYNDGDPVDGYDDLVWLDNIEYITDYEPEPVNPGGPDAADFNAAVNAVGENREFTNDSVHPWQIAQDGARTCAVSDIAGLDSTEAGFTVDVGYLAAGSTITFDWKTDCEAGWDRVCLTINGYTCKVASGQTGWTTVTYTIENSGEYVIGWKYEKSHAGNGYSDRVWVDNIKIDPEGSAPQPGTVGDVDGDGSVSMADAVLIMRHAMGLAQISPEYLQYADVNVDGQVSILDAVSVMRMAMGLA